MHPNAYTVKESVVKGWWDWIDKDGKPQYGGNNKEIAEDYALYYKGMDEFYEWQEKSENLSNEDFIKEARKFHKQIYANESSQNWLRDELLMRLILKNS
ncbi:MAG: hypothetical protein FMNOHCHN_03428 [Ignavibacteriaceae bacterium]|nr:hypothetical protein [Ignavibacteriaceae bacterium]